MFLQASTKLVFNVPHIGPETASYICETANKNVSCSAGLKLTDFELTCTFSCTMRQRLHEVLVVTSLSPE